MKARVRYLPSAVAAVLVLVVGSESMAATSWAKGHADGSIPQYGAGEATIAGAKDIQGATSGNWSTALRRHSAQPGSRPASTLGLAWGDVNCDGTINVFDVIMILRYVVGLTAALGPCEQNSPLTVFIGPRGDDRNDGLTLDTAILTLARAQEVIREQVPERDRDVEVRIGPGTYRNQTVEWTFTMPDHSITFMPLFDDKNRPVFDGTGQGGTWFTLTHSAGQKTNLIFHYIQVQNYATAISLNGNRNQEQASNHSNRIYGSMFRDIGEGSTAAVRLVNSKDNAIINSHFVNILRENCAPLHAIYAAHMSSGNRILRNRFENACGDPVRIRDYSNNNSINDNVFIRTGIAAAYTDWYCDHDVRDDCTKQSPECPSWDNEFRDNILDRNYAGGRLNVWRLFQDDETTGCSRPSPDSRRLRTSGNVHR